MMSQPIQVIFWLKKNWVEKNVGLKKVLVGKYFWSEKRNFGQTKFLVGGGGGGGQSEKMLVKIKFWSEKHFGWKNNLWSEIIIFFGGGGRKKMWSKKNLLEKILGQKKFWSEKNVGNKKIKLGGVENFVGSNKILVKKIQVQELEKNVVHKNFGQKLF